MWFSLRNQIFLLLPSFSGKSLTLLIVFTTFLMQRPEKYLGDLETWEKAEASLTEALNEFGKDWQVRTSLSFHVSKTYFFT